MPKRDRKVWKAAAGDHWPGAQAELRVVVDFYDDQSTTMKKSQVELEVAEQLVIIRQEDKRKAMVEWLKDVSKVTGEAAVWLEGLRVED